MLPHTDISTKNYSQKLWGSSILECQNKIKATIYDYSHLDKPFDGHGFSYLFNHKQHAPKLTYSAPS